MFSKNIILKISKNINRNKRVTNLLKNELKKNSPLLNSLTDKYKYSFKKKEIKKLQNYKFFNLIGMGGSILGAEAIYDFLSHKIKKNFTFYNNLQFQNKSKNNKKKINLVISKSGNTLETVSNFNLLLQNEKKK